MQWFRKKSAWFNTTPTAVVTMEIAQNSIQMLQDDEVDARSAAPVRTLNLNNVKTVRKTVSRADGTVSDNDTLLYIFNFDDNQGFAVVSASRQTDGLIAVTEAGNYDPAVPTGNPGFDMYMKMAVFTMHGANFSSIRDG